MDLLTHTVLTSLLIGRKPGVLLAGIGPDLTWYATYPPWVIATRRAKHALRHSEWPDPPRWMLTLHHASHSLPVAILVAVVIGLLRGHLPKTQLAAWLLHILIDIPTHSRRFWGPRFLWPLSDVAVDGVPWAEITSRALSRHLSRARRAGSGH